MIRPLRAFIMGRITACESLNTELKLVEITSDHSSPFIRIDKLSLVIPALLTKISMRPNSLTMPSMMLSHAASSVTFKTLAEPPCGFKRAAIAWAPASVVAVPITVAPQLASSWAIA